MEISMTNLRAGIAKADITPSILIPLGGYTSRTGPATGIRDPLHVTAIVFDDGIKQAAIVSLDLIQVNASLGKQIYETVSAVTGIPAQCIILNASHTHGSPWPWTDDDYAREITVKTAGAVKMAQSGLVPVSLDYGEGNIDFNVSRRILDENGKSIVCLNPNGIADNRLKVLRIDNSDAISPMAVIAHAVCHPNVFRQLNTKVSADFPGEAKTFIENTFGQNTTAMFLQGCAGDIRANLPDKNNPERIHSFGRSGDEADMIWCGWTTGTEAVKVASRLRIYDQVIKRPKCFKIRAGEDSVLIKADPLKLENILFPREKIINGKVSLSLKIIILEDICFVGIPGEPVVEYGLKIEEILKSRGMKHVFVLGYLDGDLGYIPVDHMFDEEGFEVAQSSVLPGCEQIIIEGVIRLFDSLK